MKLSISDTLSSSPLSSLLSPFQIKTKAAERRTQKPKKTSSLPPFRPNSTYSSRIPFWVIAGIIQNRICLKNLVVYGIGSRGGDLMPGDELVELKFRLFDGTDIGPNKYHPSTTVGSLKETILARWPQDKEITPKTIHDVKLINAGKILENNRTIAESRVPVGELSGGVITMHVVVRPPLPDKNNEKQIAKGQKQNRCTCTIL